MLRFGFLREKWEACRRLMAGRAERVPARTKARSSRPTVKLGLEMLAERILPSVSNGVVSAEVWFDSNSDGILNGSESGLSAITVDLESPTGQILLSTMTDANGNYSFNVDPSLGSQFQIQVAIPAGDSATIENVSSPGIVSNINASGLSNVFGLGSGSGVSVNAGFG